jgi:hypothetical protein
MDQQFVFKAFPRLYKQHKLNIHQSCMAWGLETPKEWIPIIYDASQEIQNICDEYDIYIEFAQVKEKFNTLRMYYDIMESDKDESVVKEWLSKIDDAIEKAEMRVLELEGKK